MPVATLFADIPSGHREYRAHANLVAEQARDFFLESGRARRNAHDRDSIPFVREMNGVVAETNAAISGAAPGNDIDRVDASLAHEDMIDDTGGCPDVVEDPVRAR